MSPPIWSCAARITGGKPSGAWRLDRWDQSVSLKYQRNPDWHLKPAYIDNLEHPIVAEYAARRAQLVAVDQEEVESLEACLHHLGQP